VSAADATTFWGQSWATFKTNAAEALKVLVEMEKHSDPFKNKPAGFATAIQGETPRGAAATSRRGPSEGAMQAQIDAPMNQKITEATEQYNANTIAIQKLNQVHNDQVGVLNAVTVGERAAAVEAQTYNQVLEQTNNKVLAAAQAGQAYQMVLAQVDAQQTQAIFAQQQELAMGQQLVAAAGMRGAAGVQLQAQLQQELALRQQGIDVTTRDSQTRIANAGAVAQQNLAMQDAAQAAQVGTQVQGQIMMYEAQTAAIGKNAAEKAKLISLAQSEVQALAAEAQGMTATAAAIRAYAGELAAAAASNARAEEEQQLRLLQRSLQATLDTVRLEISLVGASSAAHAYHTTLLQYENQARQAEIQGLSDAAAEYRNYGEKIARATAQLERRKQALQEAEAAEQAAAAAAKQTRDQQVSEAKAFQSKGFTSTMPYGYAQGMQVWSAALARSGKVMEKIPDIEKQAQQRQLSIASQTIGGQISALQDQKSALDDNTQTLQDNISALEKDTQKRREQLDKQIAKLEKALNPSRPDPYAERNPDYFYRFGTQAFKENDPMQALLTAAEAERDGLDNQLDAMKEQLEQQKKAVELQQKAIDAQIKGYEAQARQLIAQPACSRLA
jgi:hypothetical protein